MKPAKEEVERQWSHDDGNTKSELYKNTKRWRRHDMDTLPTLLALCEENVPLSRERVSSAETVTPSSCTALHSLGFSIAFIEITIPCIDFHLSDENSSIEFFNMMPKTVTIRREENFKWALSMTLNSLASAAPQNELALNKPIWFSFLFKTSLFPWCRLKYINLVEDEHAAH